MSEQTGSSHLFKEVKEPSAEELEFQPKWSNRAQIASFSPTTGASMQPFTGGGKLMMMWVTIEPNTDYPYHQHPHEQMGYMLEGELELSMAGETRLLKAGDCYAIPPFLPHRARTLEKSCLVLDVFTPIREDYNR
jgi:quercetin dioxygenase-like cupin family protein